MYTVAVVRTESSDTYVYIYKNKPTHEDVIRKVWELESGSACELDWYMSTTAVYFYSTKVEDA